MKILHYSLGLPPYRTGGLTKYSVDLMKEQTKQGSEVYLLYPGKINIFDKRARIVKNKDFDRIKVYELINPLPVPLIFGIKDTKKYIRRFDINIFIDFLKKIDVDCIHIHTFMGLPREFLVAAHDLKIKIVFTSHDYFGLCPKSSLYNTNHQICEGYNNKECSLCCANALSYKKIVIMQSHLYKKVKDTKIIQKIRNNEKNEINSESMPKEKCQIYNYENINKYFYSMFKYIDIFHFNSNTAYEIYNKHLKISNYQIIPITHSGIKDNRRKYNRESESNIIRIGYLGSQSIEKGFFELIQTLDKIENKNIRLSLYFRPNIKRDYFDIHENYNYNQLEEIFRFSDIIIMPSLVKETFGFVVLEALSYGVPVIVSQNVGAKEIIKNSVTGYIYKDTQELCKILEKLNVDEIQRLNNNILKENAIVFDMEEHTKEILKLYKVSVL